MPHLSAVRVERALRVAGQVVIEGRVRAVKAPCPRCGQVSGRVHGGYVRQLRDAAVGGVQVVILLRVRRFRCGNEACSAVTFAEQVDGLTSPHSRFTPLLRGLLTQIGLALAGRAGVRLAVAAGVAVGRADLAAWLRGHPEVAVICRDRSGGYGEGARAGAPQAIQVADRFHLWQNLGQAVEKTVNTCCAYLGEPAPRPPAQTAPAVVQPSAEKKIVIRMRTHYAAVQELQAQGLPLSASTTSGTARSACSPR
jgi:transposase